jgi:hypothetical protein
MIVDLFTSTTSNASHPHYHQSWFRLRILNESNLLPALRLPSSSLPNSPNEDETKAAVTHCVKSAPV